LEKLTPRIRRDEVTVKKECSMKRRGITLVALLVVTGACGDGVGKTRPVAADATELALHMRARFRSGDRAMWFTKVADAMPSAVNRSKFVSSATEVVVVGSIVGAELGVGFVDDFDPNNENRRAGRSPSPTLQRRGERFISRCV
jgi:hypothetical protein